MAISVGITASPATLIEEQETVTALTFTLSEAPPAGGLVVSIDSPLSRSLAQFDVFSAQFDGAQLVSANADASGLTLRLTKQVATIELPVFNDTVPDSPLAITYALQTGTGYEINPSASAATITIQDSDSPTPTPTPTPTPNPAPTPTPAPNEPVVSLQTVTGAYGVDDKVLATGLVDGLVPFETGTSVLSFVLSASGEIPEDGLVVTVNTDVELSDYFGRLGRTPFTPGGQILEVLYDDQGKTTGFKFRMDSPNAVINLNVKDDGNVEGVREATFTLADGEGYAVAGSAASTVKFYDTIAQVPQPTVVPEVGFTVDKTALVEADGTAVTLSFTLSEKPPAEGVLVYVLSPQRGALSEFDVLNADVTGGVFPPANFQSSGFYFKITEQTASITLPAFNDGDQEGIEELMFAIQSGPGYTIADDASTVTVDIADIATSQIQVGLTTSPAVLIEADQTVSVHTFSLSDTPPADGLTVAVVAPNISEFDLSSIVVEGGEIARVTPTGFDLKITAKTATISLPVADDGEAEGVETVVFTLQDGSTYQVVPTAIEGTFTIVDTADQAPAATTVTEPNDTLAKAFDVKLSDASPVFKIKSAIDYNGANSAVDATEDVDFYRFTLKAGETVTIDTDANAVDLGNFVNTNFNTVLRLFDANGQQLALNNNGSAPDEVFFRTTDSYISYTAETDGAYYVAVSSSNNSLYDPNRAGSGSGGTRGTYDLEIKLNPVQPETTALPRPDAPADNAPTVTIDTVVGTFDGVLPTPTAPNPNFDNIVVPALVQSLAPSLARGQSLLTFSFQTEGEIPPEGLEVFVKADGDIAEFLNKDARVLLVGANTSGPIYNNTGELIGFKLTLFEPQSNATFVLQNKTEAETDGPETLTFTLLPTSSYKIAGDATLPVTVYDTIEQATAAVLGGAEPEVSIRLSQTALVESEGTETTLTFNVDGEIPAEGLLVYVDSPTRTGLGDLDLTKAKIVGGEFPPANFDASGFYFKVKEDGASITFKALDELNLPLIYTPEEAAEGLEGFNYKLVDAPGYTVNSTASEVKFTIADNPDSVVRVSLTGSPAVLIEADKTVAKLNFSLSAPPSEDGVMVTIAAPEMLEFDPKGLAATGGTLVSAAPDNTSFTFKITSQTASVDIPIADDGVDEDLETATFTLQPGTGYEVSPTASVATFTLVDTAADVPPITREIDTGATGNDTLATANRVALTYGEATISAALSGRAGVDASEDVDLYAITLKAGETIKLDVDSIPYTITETTREQRVDTELRLFDASGMEVAYNAENPAPGEIFLSGRDAYLEYTATADGVYYVGVAQLGNRNYNPNQQASGSGRIFPNSGINTGAYTLDFTLDAAADPVPTPANDLLDLRPFTGAPKVEVSNKQSDALFTNVVGFYRIEDNSGTVLDPLTGNALEPGDAGYAAAALRRSQTTGDGFSFGIKGTEAVVTTNLKGGALYAPFIVSDGTIEQGINGSKDVFFDFAAANPMGIDHVKKSSNSYSFEDYRGGFDLDFNDAVFSVRTTVA